MKKYKPNHHTVSESITVTLSDGKIATGILWLHPSLMGSFEVEYNGIRKPDGRTDYTNVGHIRAIAKVILKEMAEK